MTLEENYSLCCTRGNIGNSKAPIKLRVDPGTEREDSSGIGRAMDGVRRDSWRNSEESKQYYQRTFDRMICIVTL